MSPVLYERRYEQHSMPRDVNQFNVATYNILAQGLVTRFTDDPQVRAFAPSLEEGYRWTLLFDQLRHFQAQVICLQEVAQRTWAKYLSPNIQQQPQSNHHHHHHRQQQQQQHRRRRRRQCQQCNPLSHFHGYFTQQAETGYGICTLFDSRYFRVISSRTVVYRDLFAQYLSLNRTSSNATPPSWLEKLLLDPQLLAYANISATDMTAEMEKQWLRSFLRPMNVAQVSSLKPMKSV